MKNTRQHLVPAREAVAACCALATSVLIAREESGTTLPTVEVVANATDSPVLYQARSSSAALFTDTPLIETPFSVGVYNQELIEDQRAFDLRDVLENDPSVALQMPGTYHHSQNFSLRGFRVDNFNGYRVDGLPFIHTVAPLIDDKERVELLKGPAALRFGLMSPGGAINLVRKRPTEDLSTSLHFDVDTFGRFYNQIDIGDTVAGGKFGYRLVLGGEEFEDFYDNAGGDRLFGTLFTEWKPTESLTIWSSIGAQDFKRNGYYGPLVTADGQSVLDPGVKTNSMQDWARSKHESFGTAIGADFQINEDWKLRSSVNYQDSERDTVATYASGVMANGDFEDAAYIDIDPSTWEAYGAHLHLEGNFETGGIGHEIVVGGQYRSYDSTFNRDIYTPVGPNNIHDLIPYPMPAPGPDIGPGRDLRTQDYTSDEIGFFLTDTIKFNEHWSTLLGLRYSKFDNNNLSTVGPAVTESSDSQSNWAPTAALMYSPVKNVHTYVTYTQGMEDPGVAIGVQESEQFEIGVKAQTEDGRFSGELAVFHIEQDQIIDIDPSPGYDPAFDGLQRHRGIEASFRGRFTDIFQAGIGAMMLDAEQVDTQDGLNDGNRPSHVPDFQVNIWGAFDIPQVPGLTLTAGARFVDKQYLDGENTFATGSYSVVDIGARYKIRTDSADYTVRLNIENVLDERYYETGEFYAGDGGYLAYGAPVHATLSLQIDF
ncbi:TonB-dependent siderophore receptor [Luteolibacter sp. SL250]|uniref:TonB-dependent siderophore receptor n=1 Tax=Luteolibacter sp. SL250 TaxID=2995170 RepID=UPI0022704706|nr:TonB-dependent siderophore receptor [Luteolibacter sp. SL250]WAC19549.1 TonB-dependent siderophore receptor [Luteolibacter sp. SL250]